MKKKGFNWSWFWRPMPEDWKIFLEHFDDLSAYEATQYVIAKHRALYTEEDRKKFPTPEVVKCYKWIKEQIGEPATF